MGEYAVYNGERIKIGTCESMYYIRYEDRNKVKPEPHSLNPNNQLDLFWRLPWMDEDQLGPGGYEYPCPGLRLIGFEDPGTLDNPGNFQLKHENGLLLNVACYHGQQLPEGSKDIKPHWNGKDPYVFELIYVKNTKEGVLPIVHCKYCSQMWRYTWEEVTPFIKDEVMKRRLLTYANGKEER